MVTLALDSSHPVGSVALARDGVLLASESFREPSSHLVALGQATDRVLGGAGLTPGQLDRLAVVTGPGSFTGLRIGLSFAKGLHAATGVAMVAIGGLRLLALPHLALAVRVCAMIDARRGEVYAAVYERTSAGSGADDPAAALERVSPCDVAPAAWLASLDCAPDVFVGTGADAFRELIADVFPAATIPGGDALLPSTAHLAIVAHRMTPLDEDAVRSLEPLYIRASGAERKRLRAHAHPAEQSDG
jgi:tRNA threonylcarbamoyladenosine biosynthesis protein TsaB